MPDVYPNDLMDRFRAMEKRLEEVEALLRQRSPLTVASQGWRMTSMAVPSVSVGECHIGCTGSEFFAQTPAGTRFMYPPMSEVELFTLPAGGTPNDALVAAGGTYDQNVINDNFRDVGAKINVMIGRFQSSGRMATS